MNRELKDTLDVLGVQLCGMYNLTYKQVDRLLIEYLDSKEFEDNIDKYIRSLPPLNDE